MTKDHLTKFVFDFFLLPVWRLSDLLVPKNNHFWAFTVHHIKSDQFVENARAVFEEIKSDETIKKIIFLRNIDADLNIENAKNIQIVKLRSLNGLWMFMRCRVVFVTHSIAMDYSLRWGSKLFSVVKPIMFRRVIINLWHGIPFKKLYALWNPLVRESLDRVKYRRKEREHYEGLITSSGIDSFAMATMFYPIKYENIWLTGLPRNDFLVKESAMLPLYLRKQVEMLHHLKNGKRLITYAPTYRQMGAIRDSTYYQFSPKEIKDLRNLLKKHDAIFGFRMHYFRNDKYLFNVEDFVDNKYIFDLGDRIFSEIAPEIRESDLLITDYSSVFFDALYVNKPVFCFAYDMEHYRNNQDGILYDLKLVCPGPVVTKYDDLLIELKGELINENQVNSVHYQISKQIFFEYVDSDNSERVIKRVFQSLNKGKY